jgi:hypothetical protein
MQNILLGRTHETLLHGAHHLLRLSTLLDTAWWLVISTGQYVNIWGCRLMTSAMNINLIGRKCQQCHCYVGCTWL